MTQNPNQQVNPEPEAPVSAKPAVESAASASAPAPEPQDVSLPQDSNVDSGLADGTGIDREAANLNPEKAEDVAVAGSTTTTTTTTTNSSLSSTNTNTDTTTATFTNTESPDQASAATQTADAQDSAQGTDGAPFFKVGDDVSQFTGRPRMTAADNQALREGSHIVKKAMHTMAHAHGEEYEPFRLPAKMRAALAQIDREAELERQKEQEAEAAAAAAEGKPLPAEDPATKANSADDPFTKMHSLTPEEQAEAEKLYAEQARIKAGGARFYGKYQKLMADQEVRKEENRMRVRRNLKLSFIVILGLMAYVGYNFFFGHNSGQGSVEELKAALPLQIDSYTSMVRIDDRNEDFKIYFEIDTANESFKALDTAQKEAKLNAIEQNAPLLCKNPLIHSIIVSGKKVTLLLEASDRSFHREFSVDKCPTADDSAQ